MYINHQEAYIKKSVDTGSDIHDIMEGKVCSNVDGCCFVIENRYSVIYIHGGCSLGEALNIDSDTLKHLLNDTCQQVCISDFLFLDTETTGLSSGVGTVAFLIGIGCFEEDTFILRQYFMRDYDEEPAMLRALNQLLKEYRGLVTFNGKAFDWNVLQTRFTFNRIKPEMPNPIHIDLLHPSRSIWKLKIGSCRLSSLEENVLGEYRVNDIPGEMIPSVYFKYLDDRDATHIKQVIKHNETDILSMVSLLSTISLRLGNPVYECNGPEELFGMGRIFEKNGEYDTVIECFEECMKSDNFLIREAALRKLSCIYKKKRDYQKAVVHWNKESGLFAMIELAKYYEHRQKDIQKALDIVEKAIGLVLKTHYKNSMHYEQLKKRKQRLIGKIGG